MEMSYQDKQEMEEEIEKSVFIFEQLYNSGLDYESSEKLAWGDIKKLDYYIGDL